MRSFLSLMHHGWASVVEKFRDKYGASDVRKYYSNFDVAVIAQIR